MNWKTAARLFQGELTPRPDNKKWLLHMLHNHWAPEIKCLYRLHTVVSKLLCCLVLVQWVALQNVNGGFHSLLFMFPCLATSFGIALPAWIVDQKNSMLVHSHWLCQFTHLDLIVFDCWDLFLNRNPKHYPVKVRRDLICMHSFTALRSFCLCRCCWYMASPLWSSFLLLW